jgi:hypothetical protein
VDDSDEERESRRPLRDSQRRGHPPANQAETVTDGGHAGESAARDAGGSMPAKPMSPTVTDIPGGIPRRPSVCEPVPKRIGRYTVRRRIGQGGFGIVYLAHDDRLDRDVAIKVPHKHHATDARRLKYLLAEAQTIANLDHPNIVGAYDGGQTDDGRFYLVSRLIIGDDLGTVIRTHRPSYRESAVLLAKVADALQYAHRRKIIHRISSPPISFWTVLASHISWILAWPCAVRMLDQRGLSGAHPAS